MPVLGSRKISALGKLSHAVSPPTMYGVYLKAIFLQRVEVPNARTKKLEARVGFEPTNGGFAGHASSAGQFPFSRLETS